MLRNLVLINRLFW